MMKNAWVFSIYASTTDNKQNNKQLKSKGGILAMHETAHFDGASNIKSRRHKKKLAPL